MAGKNEPIHHEAPPEFRFRSYDDLDERTVMEYGLDQPPVPQPQRAVYLPDRDESQDEMDGFD